MKNINIYTKMLKVFVCMLLMVTVSCDDEEDIMISNSSDVVAPKIVTQTLDIVLRENNEGQEALLLEWNEANYGQITQVDYVVQMAEKGTNFETPVFITQTSQTRFSISVEELNGFATAAGLNPFVKGDVELRVISKIGSQGFGETISDVLPLSITSYEPRLPSLSVPGNHQGWDPSKAALISAEAGKTNYEGYMWLNGAFKFVAPDANNVFAWGNIDYGDDGTSAGVLAVDDEVNVDAPVAGHYFVQVDTNKATYSITKYEWGIIGDATPGGWVSDEDMTYNATTNVWELTTSLTVGQLKFRANDDWVWSYGDVEGDGVLEITDTNISIAEAGNYKIVMDLSNPRAYTYTITKN